MKTGVYQILNLMNGKCYIGSAAVSFRIRWKDHRRYLRRGAHHSTHLQRAWNSYGEASFEFRIIEKCASEDCVTREQFWIDHYESFDRSKGYNMSPTAGSLRGMPRKPLSEESKKKIGDAHRGKKGHPISAETREKINAGIRAKKRSHSPETRLKMSITRKGKKKSEEFKRKLSLANTGRKHSPETIAKLTGRKRTPEQVQAMRERQTGRTHSAETRRKISLIVRGRRLSEERKIQQSEYKRKWWAQRKIKLFHAEGQKSIFDESAS